MNMVRQWAQPTSRAAFVDIVTAVLYISKNMSLDVGGRGPRTMFVIVLYCMYTPRHRPPAAAARY